MTIDEMTVDANYIDEIQVYAVKNGYIIVFAPLLGSKYRLVATNTEDLCLKIKKEILKKAKGEKENG